MTKQQKTLTPKEKRDFWDQFKAPTEASLTPEERRSFWDQFKQKQPEASEDSVGKFAARTGKSLAVGAVGGLADTVTAPYNLAATAHNVQRQGMDADVYRAGASFSPDMPDMPYDTDLPLIPSATETIDEKIDQATGGYTTTPESEKPLHAGLKFAAGVATPGGLGKLANVAGHKGLGNAFNAVGSLKPSSLTGAMAAGATTEAAQQAGHSGGRALGEGLAAGLITDLMFHKAPRSLVKLSGLGKKNLNLKGIDAAERLGVDIPNIGFTDSKAANLGAQIVGKTPILGDKLKDKFTKSSDDYKKAFGDMLDKVGPRKTEEVSQNIAKKYDLMNKSIPEADTVLAKDLLETIEALEAGLVSTFHAAPTKSLLEIAGKIKNQIVEKIPSLPEGFDKMAPEVQIKVREAIKAETQLKPISVKKLLRQKAELNKFMKDRNIFDRTDADTLNLLKRIQGATDRELEAYGKSQNKVFLERLKDANTSYAKTAKRETLDDLLSQKLNLGSSEEVAYKPLVTLLQKREHQKTLKNSLGEKEHKRLDDFIEAAKSLNSMQKNNPNPSGTATAGALLSLVFHPVAAVKYAIGGTAAYTLLTNKKFLNLATRYAKEPTVPLAKQIENLFKKETGMTLQAANKIMHETGDTPDNQ